MKYLSIGENFKLPLELVTSTQAILARKRSGKSYTASVEAEEMLELHQQIVVIDPTSAWYGLRSSADGEGPGYGVVVFGGEHADAPLDFRSGKAMARAVVEHGFSAVFDIGDWITDEQIQFVYEFSSELLRVNRSAIHLFLDEADTFAPQLLEGKEHKKCLGATSRLVKQGGIKGIGVTMITQRGADLNKKVLSQIDMLTVLRMSHPPDIKPVMDWISANISPAYAEEVAGALPRLEVGEAFVCSGPRAHGERVKIRLRRTFNSGATPKPGERKIAPRVLASIDIKKLGAEIQASIERAKADDPAVLRQKIAELERAAQRQAKQQPAVLPDHTEELVALRQQVRDLSTHLAEARRRAESLHGLVDTKFWPQVEKLKETWVDVTTAMGQIRAATDVQVAVSSLPTPISARVGVKQSFARSQEPRPAAPAVQTTVQPQPRRATDTPSADLTGPETRILNAMARLYSANIQPCPRVQVALLADYTNQGSKGFANSMSALSSRRLIRYPSAGMVEFTDEGRELVEIDGTPLSNEELHGRILALLPGPETRILRALLDHYPRQMSRTDLGSRSGYGNLGSKGFANSVSRLSSLGLIEYPERGMVRAKDLLFPEGR